MLAECQMRNGLALGRYLRHFRSMKSATMSGRDRLSRRFCVAPMMESKNCEQKTLLFGYLAKARLG